MAFDPKRTISNYFKRKKPLSIISDFVFVLFVVLMLIPSTRKEIAGFLIGAVSLPPSTLDVDEQFTLNQQAINWSFYTLEGERLTYRDLKGKPVFLNIWATWCPPCVGELPSIQSLYETYGDKVHFVLLSDEDPEIVEEFAAKHDYKQLPFYYYNTMPADFSSNSIPTTFVIDRKHKVLIHKKGAADWDSGKVSDLLDELLNQ